MYLSILKLLAMGRRQLIYVGLTPSALAMWDYSYTTSCMTELARLYDLCRNCIKYFNRPSPHNSNGTYGGRRPLQISFLWDIYVVFEVLVTRLVTLTR